MDDHKVLLDSMSCLDRVKDYSAITIGTTEPFSETTPSYPLLTQMLLSELSEPGSIFLVYGQVNKWIHDRCFGENPHRYLSKYGKVCESNSNTVEIWGLFDKDVFDELGMLPVASSEFWVLNFAASQSLEQKLGSYDHYWPYRFDKLGDIIEMSIDSEGNSALKCACIPGGENGYRYTLISDQQLDRMQQSVYRKLEELGLSYRIFTTGNAEGVNWHNFG